MKRILLVPVLALGLLALPACTTTSAVPAPTAQVPATAADTKPSESSLKELLTVTNCQQLMDSSFAQIDGMMRGQSAQAMQGKTPNAAQQAILDGFLAKGAALMREEFAWSKLEPVFLRIYAEALTQEEIEGMIAFYKTPAGQAAIKKMPVVMQKTMGEMQAIMGPFMQKFQQLGQETGAKLKAAETPSSEAPAPAPAP